MSVMILEHIKKSFDGREVLKDINIAVEEGEVVSLLGPSGSGKSTLLRCATDLEERDSGEVQYEKNEEGKADFGLVFQNFNLFPHFSVMKNIIDAPIKNQKRPRAEVEAEARQLLKKMGLEDKEEAYPCELSGGQQQRVAIARALASKPSIILADEPTGNLDSRTSDDVIGLLKITSGQFHQTIVMITHNPDIAARADRVVRIEDGKIV